MELRGLDPMLHTRPAMIYSLGLLIFGGQLMSIGFLAELIIAYQGRDSDSYSVSERIGESNASSPAIATPTGEPTSRPTAAADNRSAANLRPTRLFSSDAESVSRPQSLNNRNHWRRRRPIRADDSRSAPRRGVYALLITLSVGVDVGPLVGRELGRPDRAENDAVTRDVAQRTAQLKADGKPVDTVKRLCKGGPRQARQAAAISYRQRSQPLGHDPGLVEHGTYEIDDIVAEPNWDTIDMVQHEGPTANCTSIRASRRC